MIKKFSSILLIAASLTFTSFAFISCGDDDGVHTHCLTNSTHFCVNTVATPIDSIIEEKCKSGLTVGAKPTVFEKHYVNVNFPKPFNECIIDPSKIDKKSITNETSVLLYAEGLHSIETVEDFLSYNIIGPEHQTNLNLEVRPYTNFKEFIKQECWSGIVLGEKVTKENVEWLTLTFPRSLKECYNPLPGEFGIIELGHAQRVGIRIDNVAPTVSSVEELLNMSFTTSIEHIDLSN